MERIYEMYLEMRDLGKAQRPPDANAYIGSYGTWNDKITPSTTIQDLVDTRDEAELMLWRAQDDN